MLDLACLTLPNLIALAVDDWRPTDPDDRAALAVARLLRDVTDVVGDEPGSTLLATFLERAASWRGDLAGAVRREVGRRVALARC